MSDKNVGPLLYVVSDIESKVAVAPVHLTEGQAFMVTMRAFRDAVDPRDALLRDISNWLVCEPIATPEDMAQSFTPFREAIDKLLGVDEAVPAAPRKPFSPEEGVVLKEVAQGLAQSAEKTVQEWMGIVYQLKNTVVGNIWRDADKQAYDSAADLPEYDRRVLYAAPDKQYRELALQLLDAQEKLRKGQIEFAGELQNLQQSIDTLQMANQVLRDERAAYRALPHTLPDNLVSHRRAWISALERLCELEDMVSADKDQVSYWQHELAAMHTMYADLDSKTAPKPHFAEEQIIFTKDHTIFDNRRGKLDLSFDPADGQAVWLFHSQDRGGDVDENMIPIDSIDNAEDVATFLMSWVYAERARRAIDPDKEALAQKIGEDAGLVARAGEPAKCGVCGQGAWACNEGGCHYLESGNGAPAEGKS